MADVSVSSGNQVDQWSKRVHHEWNRSNQFSQYMGKTTGAPIQVIEELKTAPGDDITVSLLMRLTNSAVSGDNTLEGNEEALGNYSHKITIEQYRNAVRVGKKEQKKTHIDLLRGAEMALKDWHMNFRRDQITDALGSANVDGSTVYASCSEAQKDAWQTANSDRILFGSAVANSTNDHSADIAKVDSTNDTLDTGIVSLAKRLAKLADPHIRPISVDKKGEFFIMFVPSYAMRDLRAESAMQQANRDAMARGRDNPLFCDGDLIWENVIIHEVPEISVISGVGAASIDVAPCYLLGAQAVGLAIGESLHAIKDMQDYDNLKGVGVAEMSGVDKLMFNSVQHGVVTVYVSGVADS